MIPLKTKPYQVNAYSPFGYLAGSATTLAYTGQLFDEYLSGYLLGNGNRRYAPSLMRFTSPDSISPFGAGGINAYAYCNDDPVNKVDPTGQMGQNTGLTRSLSLFGLVKKDLKGHLKPLAKPEVRGKSLRVMKVNGETFTTYEFTGNSPTISSRIVAQLQPIAELSGVYFKKGDVYIPAPPRSTGLHLRWKKFERVELIPSTHAFITPVTQPSVPVRQQMAVPNDYVEDIRR
ncbi:RHS repeat-associated core domain-containing protein [Pseudomonas xanthosomatis]|uniref:RHS repeat-associated core domain-containing protein n=1 Tax=Pseudomonas xanthosomatis TaxID=2842356 RepID=UPI003F5AD101